MKYIVTIKSRGYDKKYQLLASVPVNQLWTDDQLSALRRAHPDMPAPRKWVVVAVANTFAELLPEREAWATGLRSMTAEVIDDLFLRHNIAA